MKQLAENLWVKHYPLALLGTDLGRTLTIIRMSSGRLALHSMAPFSATNLAEIRTLGEPSWLVEAMLLHDTYTRQGRDAFPNIPFLAPDGFNQVVNLPPNRCFPPPPNGLGTFRSSPSEVSHASRNISSCMFLVAR
jgi:hypothetical protein